MLTIKISYKGPTGKRGARVVCESFYGNHTFPYDYAASNSLNTCADKAFEKIKADLADRGMTWQDTLTRKLTVSIPGGDDMLAIYG